MSRLKSVAQNYILVLYNSQQIEKNLNAIETVKQKLTLISFDANAAQLFGKTKAHLKQQGTIMMDAGIMIASLLKQMT